LLLKRFGKQEAPTKGLHETGRLKHAHMEENVTTQHSGRNGRLTKSAY